MMQTPARRRYAVSQQTVHYPFAKSAIPGCADGSLCGRQRHGGVQDQRNWPFVSNGDCDEGGAWPPALLASPDPLPVRAD